jgi:hypothetical protein
MMSKMRRFICISSIIILLLLTSCFEEAGTESRRIMNEENNIMEIISETPFITTTAPDSMPHSPEIRIPFDSLEDWWEYEFDTFSHGADSRNSNLSTYEKQFIVPVFPNEYGEYRMVRDQGARIYFYYDDISAPKIREFKELYGRDGYMYALVSQSVIGFLHGGTLEDMINKEKESYERGVNPNKGLFIYGYVKNNEMNFAYIYRNGIDIIGNPFSSATIYTFYDDIYYIFMRIPARNEEDVLDFINEIKFETIVIGDTSMIAEVAEAHRAEQVEREVMVEDLHDE